MIKLKLGKLSDKFINFPDNAQIEAIVFGIEKPGILITIGLKGSINIVGHQYKKSEFWKALKDFLILRKIMEKNNDKK